MGKKCYFCIRKHFTNNMELNILTAISPVDGRYRGKAEPFAGYFSEYALIKYRVFVEIEYFIALCELPLPQLQGVDKALYPRLRAIYENLLLRMLSV